MKSPRPPCAHGGLGGFVGSDAGGYCSMSEKSAFRPALPRAKTVGKNSAASGPATAALAAS